MSKGRDQVVAAALACLRGSPYRRVRQLTCELAADALVLHGRVSTFHEKQQAQETIRNVEGVRRIVNQVTVD